MEVIIIIFSGSGGRKGTGDQKLPNHICKKTREIRSTNYISRSESLSHLKVITFRLI